MNKTAATLADKALAHPLSDSPEELLLQHDMLLQFQAHCVVETSAQMTQMRQQDAAWYDRYDEVHENAFAASPSDLLDLLSSAPTPFANGLVAGICSVLCSVASVTGRLH